MIKKITTYIVALYSVFSFAQQSTSSPYSLFGIGENKFKGTPEQRAMGGLGILPDSIHLNLLNPASYSTLKLTAISVGGGTTFNKMTSNEDKTSTQRTSLDYLAIGIPMGKFGAAFGLNPQTAVGYQNESIIVNENNTSVSRYIGEGGANRVFAGGAYQITSDFSVGMDLNYYFGTISTESKMYTSGVQYGSGIFNELELNGFNLNFGAMFKKRIKGKYEFYTSASYSPSYKLSYTKNSTLATLTQASNGMDVYVDSNELPKEKESFEMPDKFSVGTGIGQLRKWFVGTEISFIGKSEINTSISGSFSNFENKNATRLSLGGYYIPKYNSFTNYFQRVTYRAGLKYENTGLTVNNKAINDMGVSAGFGLPIGNGFSDLGFAFEYGKRGTKSAGLVQENYFNINISLTITDRWFRKYLYD